MQTDMSIACFSPKFSGADLKIGSMAELSGHVDKIVEVVHAHRLQGWTDPTLSHYKQANDISISLRTSTYSYHSHLQWYLFTQTHIFHTGSSMQKAKRWKECSFACMQPMLMRTYCCCYFGEVLLRGFLRIESPSRAQMTFFFHFLQGPTLFGWVWATFHLRIATSTKSKSSWPGLNCEGTRPSLRDTSAVSIWWYYFPAKNSLSAYDSHQILAATASMCACQTYDFFSLSSRGASHRTSAESWSPLPDSTTFGVPF
jgi:hypothetical protein